MKKLFIPSILFCIAISLFLSSCGSSTSITKRRYSRGYYINHVAGKHSPKAQQEKIALNHTKAPVKTAAIEPRENIGDDFKLPAETKTKPNIITANNVTAKNNVKSKETATTRNKASVRHTILPVEFSVKKEFKSIRNLVTNKNSASADDDDGLSLFWVVILVVLILFLLGAISGNFFGGLLYILLVIFLILLILWLLRIL